MRDRLFSVMFGQSTRAAKRFDMALAGAIVTTVGVVVAASVPGLDPGAVRTLRAVEIGFTILFSVEYVLRLVCHRQPGRYALSAFGLIDLLSIAPTWLAFLVPGAEASAVLRGMRLLRVVRVFSLGRFSRAARTITTALEAARYRIFAFLVAVALAALVAGTLIHLIEGPDSGFDSILTGMYWAVMTMTAAGHATLAPATAAGHFLNATLAVAGYAVIALSVAIVASEVMSAQRARDELLEGPEDHRREYKSSAIHSYGKELPEKALLETSVLKPVAGFLNARGGTLILGVADDGKPLGIQADLDRKNWDADKYVQHLTTQIARALSPAAAANTTIGLESYKGVVLCVLEVEASPDPVWLTKEGKRVFYVRHSNSTRELAGPDLLSYHRRRWS